MGDWNWHIHIRVDSLEKTLVLGGIGGRRKRGRQRMRWLDGITNSIDMTELLSTHYWGFPRNSVSKESACNAGDQASIPGSGRSPGEGNGNLLQYSYLENPIDRKAWWATVQRVQGQM